jgi:hypothetical protein
MEPISRGLNPQDRAQKSIKEETTVLRQKLLHHVQRICQVGDAYFDAREI